MALSSLRSTLKTALTDNTKYSCYDHVPEVIIPPCVLILAGDPYLEPIVIGNNKNWRVRLTLEVVGATYSNLLKFAHISQFLKYISAIILI